MVDPNDLMDVKEAVKYSGLTRQRLYQIAKDVGLRIGSSWVFSKTKIDAYKQAPKDKGGRPKSESPIPSPVIRLVA